MRILVTGATGYIGSHVCKALKDQGFYVVGTDYNDNQNNIENIVDEYFNYDIRTKYNGVLGSIFHRYDKLVHIAAKTKVPDSVKDPWGYNQTNVLGTFNMAKDFSNKHFIYCSTGSAFDPGSNPYASTKWYGELITKQLCEKWSIVRFYNVSGNNGFKKYDDEVSHLIRKAARVVNAVKNKSNSEEHSFMPLYGIDYDTRDGTCIRNYTHITDIVDGIIRIVKSEPSGEIDCLGSPDGTSVKEVIDTMKEVSGIDFEVRELPRRDGDIGISTIPTKSKFFKQKRTLAEMCSDALRYEIND
tara:strand:- start:668 stop:1567 length:900 start_codon:yes stop_codon:yes gene_type:complete